VLIADPPDVIRRKFKSAVTDSGHDVRRAHDKPGITNLIDIMSVATGERPESIEERYDGEGYGRFKTEAAEAVVALLEPVRLRYAELLADPGELEQLLRRGAEKAAEASAPTLTAMYDRMGFTRR
jgi:tryptophanyl-tRNA synthetase